MQNAICYFVVGEIEERERVRLAGLQRVAQLRSEGVSEAVVTQLQHLNRVTALDCHEQSCHVRVVQLTAGNAQSLKTS